jgi:peptidoglycan/xylan/chitin deacetylase (PgdA/CDA1 family)
VRPSMTRLFAALTLATTALTGCSAGQMARRVNPDSGHPSKKPAAATATSSKWAIPAFAPAPPPVPITLPPGDAVPFLHAIPTNQRVAFLTIDDGYTKVPDAPELIAAAHVPVTLFLTENAIRDNPGFFAPMQRAGAVIEDHTITHTELRGRSYSSQKHEICDSADQLGKWYGRRPVLFRPPFGDEDRTTLRAAHDCGMRAAFMWKATVDKGKVRYQEGHTLKPGDIVLMHFRPAFVKDFLAALAAIHRAGLTPALLDDYVPAA